MIIAYVRVSSEEQNEARQLEAIKTYKIDKVFIDKKSGKNTNRPEFNNMMDFIREGDTVVVSELTRLSRSTLDLYNTISEFNKKRIKLISIKEGVIDTSTPTGKMWFGLLAVLSEFERETIKQRQAEGIAVAKKEGKYRGRKVIKIDNEEEIMSLWINKKITATKAAELLGCTRGTVYNKKKQYLKIGA